MIVIIFSEVILSCEHGGETLLVDMKKLRNQMQRDFPNLWQKFQTKSVQYHRKLTLDKDDPLFFSSWKEQFHVKNKEEMYRECESQNYKCQFEGKTVRHSFSFDI